MKLSKISLRREAKLEGRSLLDKLVHLLSGQISFKIISKQENDEERT